MDVVLLQHFPTHSFCVPTSIAGAPQHLLPPHATSVGDAEHDESYTTLVDFDNDFRQSFEDFTSLYTIRQDWLRRSRQCRANPIAQAAASACSSTTATPCSTAAMRTELWIAWADTECFFNVFS